MKRFMVIAIIAILMVANIFVASQAAAHSWGGFQFARSRIQIENAAYYTRAYASAAISEWDSRTILTLPQVNYHTDVSLYDGYYGYTGWGGLATIVSSSGYYITHAHAQYNLSYASSQNDMRGIWCQEIGHTFGLQHSNDGCMGLRYYNNLWYTVPHNWNDIYYMYRGR